MRRFYMLYALASVVICLSASVILFCICRNIQGGVWAGVAAILAAECFFLHFFYLSDKLQVYCSANSLENLNFLNFVFILFCSTFFIWYVFIAVYFKVPLFDYEKTVLFPCAFSFVAGKWGFHVYYATKEYSLLLSTNFSSLILTA